MRSGPVFPRHRTDHRRDVSDVGERPGHGMPIRPDLALCPRDHIVAVQRAIRLILGLDEGPAVGLIKQHECLSRRVRTGIEWLKNRAIVAQHDSRWL